MDTENEQKIMVNNEKIYLLRNDIYHPVATVEEMEGKEITEQMITQWENELDAYTIWEKMEWEEEEKYRIEKEQWYMLPPEQQMLYEEIERLMDTVLVLRKPFRGRDESDLIVTRYGHQWMEYMENFHPKRWKELKQKKELEMVALQVQLEVMDRMEAMHEVMDEDLPEDFWECVQTRNMNQMIIERQALEEILFHVR